MQLLETSASSHAIAAASSKSQAGEKNGSDKKNPRRGKPRPWPRKGYVLLDQILGAHGGPIPVSKARWYKGIASGEFPKPISVGGRAAWRLQDIDALMERLEREATPPTPRGVRKK